MTNFDISQIDDGLDGATQSKETISTYFLHHLLVLDACGFFGDTDTISLPISLFSEKEVQKFASCSLL